MHADRKEAKREHILDAAVLEIARSGYYKTTVSAIARRAGVADGTIYLYFKNKEEILISIFDRAMGRFLGEGALGLAGRPDAETKLRGLVELHLSVLGRDRDLAVIFQVELRHSLHFLHIFSRSRMREYLAMIAAIVEQGKREGRFAPGIDPLFAAKAIFGILDEMTTDWILSSKNTRLESRAEPVAALLLQGLRPS
jgi:TetR/AcrR family fatty acid metabolism transcriptional regulator